MRDKGRPKISLQATTAAAAGGRHRLEGVALLEVLRANLEILQEAVVGLNVEVCHKGVIDLVEGLLLRLGLEVEDGFALVQGDLGRGGGDTSHQQGSSETLHRRCCCCWK